MTGGDGASEPVGDTVRIGLLNQENDVSGSFPELRLGIEGPRRTSMRNSMASTVSPSR